MGHRGFMHPPGKAEADLHDLSDHCSSILVLWLTATGRRHRGSRSSLNLLPEMRDRRYKYRPLWSEEAIEEESHRYGTVRYRGGQRQVHSSPFQVGTVDALTISLSSRTGRIPSAASLTGFPGRRDVPLKVTDSIISSISAPARRVPLVQSAGARRTPSAHPAQVVIVREGLNRFPRNLYPTMLLLAQIIHGRVSCLAPAFLSTVTLQLKVLRWLEGQGAVADGTGAAAGRTCCTGPSSSLATTAADQPKAPVPYELVPFTHSRRRPLSEAWFLEGCQGRRLLNLRATADPALRFHPRPWLDASSAGRLPLRVQEGARRWRAGTGSEARLRMFPALDES